MRGRHSLYSLFIYVSYIHFEEKNWWWFLEIKYLRPWSRTILFICFCIPFCLVSVKLNNPLHLFLLMSLDVLRSCITKEERRVKDQRVKKRKSRNVNGMDKRISIIITTKGYGFLLSLKYFLLKSRNQSSSDDDTDEEERRKGLKFTKHWYIVRLFYWGMDARFRFFIGYGL